MIRRAAESPCIADSGMKFEFEIGNAFPGRLRQQVPGFAEAFELAAAVADVGEHRDGGAAGTEDVNRDDVPGVFGDDVASDEIGVLEREVSAAAAQFGAEAVMVSVFTE